jgi:HD-GYP domain-containing protein (c-di-GMP phosphodiesterase class II)
MRLCSIQELRPGMKIARNVTDDRLELIVASGIILDLRMITRLESLEVDDVYIEESGTEDIVPEDMISDQTRRHTHKLLRRTFSELMNISEMTDLASDDVTTILQYDDRYSKALKLQSFHEAVHTTIEDLMAYHVEVFETPTVKRYLNRNYEHALNTSILSIMIGRSFNYVAEDLVALGAAAMLHDIGKLVYPSISDKKLIDLTPDELKKLRFHPEAGALIVSKSAVNTNIEQATIRQHHEQQDGRGYPSRLAGSNIEPVKWRVKRNNEIFRMAEILAVSNAFDNLLNGDLVVAPMTPAQAIESLVRGAGTIYNHAVVSKAMELINIYPVGSMVEIKTGNMMFPAGMRGVVRRGAGINLKRPEIMLIWDNNRRRITPRILDLSHYLDIVVDLV